MNTDEYWTHEDIADTLVMAVNSSLIAHIPAHFLRNLYKLQITAWFHQNDPQDLHKMLAVEQLNDQVQSVSSILQRSIEEQR